MPRIPFRGFVNGSYQARGVRLDQQRCVNMYVELDQSGLGSSEGMLVSCPGLVAFATLPGAPVRALYTAANGRVFAVGGSTLCEVQATGGVVSRGTLATSTGLVSLCDDGTNLTLVDGTYGYVLNMTSLAFAQITDADWKPATHCVYLDGYTLFNESGTGRFFWSNLLDPSNIDSLNFATAEASADPLVAIVVVHRELWLFGTRTTEIWFSTGDANSPFQRIQGALIDIGCAAAYSARPYADTVAWLAADPAGGSFVAVAQGYQARRVSTHAIELALGEEGQVQDAVAFTQSYEAHRFYALSIPESDTTFVVDAATGLWHERAALQADGSLSRHRCHVGTAAFGKILGGDFASGQIYVFSLDAYDDAGIPLLKERISPWLNDRNMLVTFHALRLDLDTGHGLPSDTLPAREPQVMMQWSQDGKTWSTPEYWQSSGALGEYNQEIAFYRLGQSRRRIFKVRISDAVPVRISNAYLDVTQDGH